MFRILLHKDDLAVLEYLINIIKYSKIIFTFLNKYLYLLTILSLLSNFYSTVKQNKLYKVLIKIIIIINLIVGTGFILYFTELGDPLTLSFYQEILEFNIEILKNLWNEFLNYSIEDSIIKNIKSTDLDLKNEIKEGVKQGVKEAFDEIISENSTPDNTNLLKQFALASSLIFFSYFFFILPGPTISPEDLTQYNWINQSLIEFKILVRDYFFNKPRNPGGSGLNNNTSPNLPIHYPAISPINSEGLSTVTPNSPVASSSSLSPFLKLDNSVGVQTELNGITVSKSIETVTILADVLDENNATLIQEGVNKIITKITD